MEKFARLCHACARPELARKFFCEGKDSLVLLGDCLSGMRDLPDCSVDSVVCDPPYGLTQGGGKGFMGHAWDASVPGVEIWKEALRVLKPGGHLLAFAGTRTHHKMASNIELAGFEIRDMIVWAYGSGMPKSLNVAKALEKSGSDRSGEWEGWGTALKPAIEPITVARKPLSENTIIANALEWGTGAINIDACRVESNGDHKVKGIVTKRTTITGDQRTGKSLGMYGAGSSFMPTNHDGGRWPANFIHDGSDDATSGFPQTASPWIGNPNEGKKGGRMFGGGEQTIDSKFEYRDSGSAARYFYSPKASKSDKGKDNSHPTVKPTDLMSYLCRLITRKGGVVLDPFMGSGSTGKAALREGLRFVGFEMGLDYWKIAKARARKPAVPD